MSVVNKIADLSVSAEKEAALSKLNQAETDLSSNSSSVSAREAKIDALLELNQFKDVANFANPQSELSYYAYALYRLERLDDLRNAISSAGDSAPVAALLALAQAEYKYGSLVSSRNILETLQSKLTNSNDLADITVNLSAIDALEGVESSRTLATPTTFDEFFNQARYFLSRGQAKNALEVLQHANGLAIDDEDRQSAISQAVYVHLALGDLEEAEKLVANLDQQLKSNELADSLKLIVSNNSLVVRSRAAAKNGTFVNDLEASHIALKAFDENTPKNAYALNSAERQVIGRNQLKLQAKVHKQGVESDAKKHLKLYPADWEPLVVALYHTHSTKTIRKLAAETSEIGEIARAVLNARTDSAWSYPTSKNSKRFEPGNVGELAAVFDLIQDQKNDAESQSQASELEAYFAKFNDEQIKQAGQHLANPSSVEASSLESSIDALIDGVDVQKLEQQEYIPQRTVDTTAKTTSAPKKRSHKRKLPEGADPNSQPDPERWLAKQDRSGYKAKRKKTQATQGGSSAATQGQAETSNVPASSSEVVGAKSKKKKGKKGK